MIRTPKPICRHPLKNTVTVTLRNIHFYNIQRTRERKFSGAQFPHVEIKPALLKETPCIINICHCRTRRNVAWNWWLDLSCGELKPWRVSIERFVTLLYSLYSHIWVSRIITLNEIWKLICFIPYDCLSKAWIVFQKKIK